MHSKGFIPFIFSLSVLFAFIPGAASAGEITVSAAISLKSAFEELGKLFEVNKGTKVLFNFGASGDLARQVEAGAPVDVFASAAQKDMDGIKKKGLVLSGSRTNFAENAVVLVVPSRTRTPVRSFEDLKLNAIKKIAAGNPKTVPAGRYAEEVFIYYKVLPSVRDKLILSENVRQVLDYAARGEVDAGIVYATDALTRAKDVKIAALAPGPSHTPIVYPIAIIKGTKNERPAKEFISLVVSPEGKRILEKYGFKTGKE